ncbi:MAG: antibiotic biosynthesis monooxygenase [Ferruginibacter sp.]
MKQLKLILIFIIVLITSSFKSVYSQSNENLIVTVKYKTQPGKDIAALIGLKNLIEIVKKEPHYVNIIVHLDADDKSNILLYEQWSNEVYYKGDHLKTKHLQQFMIDSRVFLAGPPEITFWTIAK